MPLSDGVDDKRTYAGPTLHSVDKAVDVLSTKLDGFMASINRRLDLVDGAIKDSLGTYATKAALDEVGKRIDGLADNQRWIVRLIISTVVLAVLVGVFKSGLVHV